MEYSAEILKIVEGCMKMDKIKVYNYTQLLIKKLKENGEIRLAEKFEKIIASKSETNLKSLNMQTIYKVPVDSESRLPIADRLEPTEIEEMPVFLNKECKNEIDKFLEYYNNRNQIINNGINLPNTLIFFGPPGCGKSKLAEYISKKTELPLITTRLDGLISSYLGSTAKNIRAIFNYAQSVPCVLFLDEFDAIAKVRDDKNELGELKRIVNSLLQNIDSIQNGSIIIAATNHEKLLDPAVWRRFMFKINLQKPEYEVRFNIINKLVSNINLKKEDIDIIAQLYEGFTGAELEQICNKVKMDAIIDKKEISLINFVEYYLRHKHIVIDNHKEKIKYLNKMNNKLFSGTNLARIFNYSKPYISQILKEDREG